VLPWYPYILVPIFYLALICKYINPATVCCHDIQIWGNWVVCWNVLCFESRLLRLVFRFERVNEARDRTKSAQWGTVFTSIEKKHDGQVSISVHVMQETNRSELPHTGTGEKFDQPNKCMAAAQYYSKKYPWQWHLPCKTNLHKRIWPTRPKHVVHIFVIKRRRVSNDQSCTQTEKLN
jgi:hypothetical protein